MFPDGDFGSGTPVIVPVNPNLAPGYVYITNPPPLDGEYTLTNNMGAWGNRFTWLPLMDNSPDPNGYFMVVNASVSPGLFYEKVVTGLCENTLYEFSADLVNLITPGTNQIQPNVSFLLDNVQLFTTGNIPENGTWTTYGFTYTTLPGQTTVTLSLRNNAPGGLGNDLGIDNISFRPCGPLASILITDTVVCESALPVLLTSQLTGNQYTTPVYQWQVSTDQGNTWNDIPGATSTTYQPPISGAGTYYYRFLAANSIGQLTNPQCHITSVQKTITVVPTQYNVADTICAGNSYTFGSQTLTASGTYTDTFLSAEGCDSIVTLTLSVQSNDLEAQLAITEPTCSYFSDGSITLLAVTNGISPLDVTLNGQPYSIPNPVAGLSGGAYTFSIHDSRGCTLDTTINLTTPPPFTIDLGPDRSINIGDTVQLTTSANFPILSYVWTPASSVNCTTNCSPITITPPATQLIILQATSDNGCVATDSVLITVSGEKAVYFPNAFTPNGDGLNDFFGALGTFPIVQQLDQLRIYNRWGQLIFQKENIPVNAVNDGWDGTFSGDNAPADSYAWVAVVKFGDGTTEVKHGYIILLR